jgi:AAA domain/Primase C terminal 2 (PriCT-2)
MKDDTRSARAELNVDRKQIETFLDALFRHAGTEGYVARRAFYDDGGSRAFGGVNGVSLKDGLKAVATAAVDAATKAARCATPVVFCWPLATFRGSRWATEQDVLKGLVLSVECDKQPAAARLRLEEILGPATAVVASGGEWTDPATGEVQPKVHLHWRLKAPAETKEALAQLKLARQLAAELVGADASGVAMCHPFRWPGSCLQAVNINVEIDLAAALLKLQAALGPRSKTVRETPSDQEASEYRVATALAVLPNEFEERADWVRVGLAVHGATGGSEYGAKAFDAWSRKWPGYDAKETARVWRSFDKSPPTEIGAGTIFDLANKARPRWEEDLDALDVAALIAAFNVAMEGGDWVAPDEADTAQQQNVKSTLLQSSAEFVAGYVPPDYFIDGLLQRRFVYSVTAPTGSGKTCIALRIAAHVARGLPIGGMEVERGRVLYFAGENPDDVRARWIKLCEAMDCDPDTMDVFFLPGSPPIGNDKIRQRINDETAKHGPFSLLIIDTSAAYFQGDDENSNTQLGDHARMLRSFVELPGGPTVLVTCHPTKNPDMSNLVPRGGGAFLAEIDGNLVCLYDRGSMIVEIDTHGKFRGPEFAPFAFQLEAGTSDKLKDSKGRSIWTIIAKPITEEEKTATEDASHAKLEKLLRVMQQNPAKSLAELATLLDWNYRNGTPNKSIVQRLLKLPIHNKLVEKRGNRYVVTNKGEKYIADLAAADPM